MPGGCCLWWGQGTLGQVPEQPGLRCSHPDPRRTLGGASRDPLGPSASRHLWPDAPGGDRKTKKRPETQRENGQKRDGQLGTHTHSGSPGESSRNRQAEEKRERDKQGWQGQRQTCEQRPDRDKKGTNREGCGLGVYRSHESPAS